MTYQLSDRAEYIAGAFRLDYFRNGGSAQFRTLLPYPFGSRSDVGVPGRGVALSLGVFCRKLFAVGFASDNVTFIVDDRELMDVGREQQCLFERGHRYTGLADIGFDPVQPHQHQRRSANTIQTVAVALREGPVVLRVCPRTSCGIA